MIALALALSLAAPLHPDSLSSSQIFVAGTEAYLTIRCQVLSVAEVIPGLDANEDEEFSFEEIEARSEEIYDYIAANYRLYTGTDRDFEGGVELVPDYKTIQFQAPGTEEAAGFVFGSVDLEIAYRATEPVRDLMVHSTLFIETSPAHIDFCSVSWSEDVSATFVLEGRSPRGRTDPEGKGVFAVFLARGWHHILGGWDHLCFLVALVLSSRRLRALLWVVTAFTLAHSVTLALMSLEVVNLYAYSDWIEAAIALSISYVAVDNLIHSRLRRPRWIEAFVFGLVHGLGFAGFLAQSLVNEHAKGMALVAFNFGVELGQVGIVLLVVLGLRFLPPRDEEFLAPRWVRVAGSVIVALLGGYWFVERMWS